MGIFDEPGDYDETSPFYWLRPMDARSLDQAVKARRAAERMENVVANAVGAASPPDLGRRVAQLETNLAALGLYARTTLTLLHDKGVISADEFSEKLRELDLLDGKIDNR